MERALKVDIVRGKVADYAIETANLHGVPLGALAEVLREIADKL